MRVFLVGMMGSGKTTLGRQLAQLLHYPFIDLDEHIVQQENKTIPQIFEEEGQERFRQLERQALEALVQEHKQAVISTGGGAPCFLNNVDFLNKHGKAIFLDVPVDEIVNRLQASDLRSRPLLAGKSADEVKSFLVKTLGERSRFYEQAQYRISGRDISAVQILQLLNHN